MLKRIVSIKNVGRFRSCTANGDVTLRPYTLMYGENARGKTTLCAILRSLITNDPSYVVGRATLGSTASPEVHLLTSVGSIEYRDGNWSATYPDIAVFDATYISENVYTGDAVDTEQKRSLYRVIIGAHGVTLASQFNELEEQIREKNRAIRDNQAQIRLHTVEGMSVEKFIALPEDMEIDAKITAKKLELQAAYQAVQLQQKSALEALTVPVFPAFADVLGKTLEDVAEGAERRVGEHVARHHMEGRGEAWINEGLSYVIDENCPFCDQDISDVSLIQAYRSFFGREYRALRDEANQLKTQVDTAVSEQVASDLEQTLVKNTASAETWRQYCELNNPVLSEAGCVGGIIGALRDAALALLAVKASAPLDAVEPDIPFTRSVEAFETLTTSFMTYNEEVATANSIISQRKGQAQIANVRDLETALANLKAQKFRHTDEVRDLCTIDNRLQGEKADLEDAKATVREQLDAHTQQVIIQYGKRIKWFLERINASFTVTTPSYTYRGGSPSTSYQIIINGNNVAIGDPRTPTDTPSFKNTLSSGDRTTLALAFFFAQLEQDPNRASKVVVFDDPFGSMDSFRRNQTVHQISRCGEFCSQVIVLSHDPSFLHLIWGRIASDKRKSLWMARIGEENTTIAEWNIEQAAQAPFRADLVKLQRFFSSIEGDCRDVVQKIRPVLEAYYRNLYPMQFGEQDELGRMIGKIRDDGATHQLTEILEELDEINSYSRWYHHAYNPNAATVLLDEEELLGYVKRTLKLVGCLP